MTSQEYKEGKEGQGSGTFQDPLEIPIGDGGQTSNGKGSQIMPAPSEIAVEQIAQSGAIAQNNFITVQKALDYDFMENRRIITLDEAVGVREVASKSVPAGPNNAAPAS